MHQLAGHMDRAAAIVVMLAVGAAGAALLGCTAPHPTVHSGDANSVEVSYAGDVASTLPVARQHCAQFERVPRLVDAGAGTDIAIYDCVRR
jgi:hypothetical protein